MIVGEIAKSHNDEYYTPAYAVRPLLKYIKPNVTVWCPFDTNESNFVKLLHGSQRKVIATHISTGSDFFNMRVPDCDYIISNPPYSKKTEVFELLFAIGRPFAMLVGVVGLFENKRRFDMFRNNSFEIMYFNKRVSYFKDYTDPKPSLNPPYSSVYLCHNMLPQTIVFEELIKAGNT